MQNATDAVKLMKSLPEIGIDNNLSLVAFKAFGDLVIAVSCLERRATEAGRRIEILLGQHLIPLFDALESRLATRVVHHSENSLPALFTIKKDGPVKALGSAVHLRRAVKDADIPADHFLIFDRLGIRERFVTNGWRQVEMPEAPNIYLAYDQFLDSLGYPLVDRKRDRNASGPLRIFPGSRVPAKNLPVELVRQLMATAANRGIATELMLLEGERLDLESCGLPYTPISRNFSSMIAAVRGAGKVISADSMPAHIAEHLGRDMFVFSPAPNRYWLPRTAYLQQWDGLFADSAESARLAAFLDIA